VPVTEIRFAISKIAEGEWCAHTATADSNKTAPAATVIVPLKAVKALKRGLLVRDAVQYSTENEAPPLN